MKRRAFLKAVPAAALASAASHSIAQTGGRAPNPAPPAAPVPGAASEAVAAPAGIGDLQPIILPTPQTDVGKSVLAALAERKTTRRISDKELPPQELSNLLWAAFGVNRENLRGGRIGRTATSASNSQEIDIYVATADGV